MSIYELARQRILAHASIAAMQVEPKRNHGAESDTKERKHERYLKFYGKPENRKRMNDKACAEQKAYKAYYGFYPSAFLYWRKKIMTKQITPGQIPDKFKVAWSDYKNGRKPWRE